jgi:hypothetical protein
MRGPSHRQRIVGSWRAAPVALLMLAGCQNFTELAVIEPGDFALVANAESLFLVEALSPTELQIVLARDGQGASLPDEGQRVERLELPLDEACASSPFTPAGAPSATSVARATTSTVTSCIQEPKSPPCDLTCGGVVWRLRAP